MKTISLKLLFALFAVILGAYTVQAQTWLEDPKYGRTPEERQRVVELINLFNASYGMQDYNDAISILHQIRAIKPDANVNIYISTGNIYKRRIDAAQSVAEKNALIDSLMTIYDWRIELFGDDPQAGRNYLEMQKALEYLAYRPNDKQGIRDLFERAIADYGNDVPLNNLNIYFNFLVNEYRADRLETDDLMAAYEKFDKIYAASNDPEKEAAQTTFEALLIQSGAADCENIEKIYRAKIADDPDNIDLFKKAFSLLEKGKCNNDFQLEMAEKIYLSDPNTQMALYLSQRYDQKGDQAKSRHYIQEAMRTETDPIAKSKLTAQLAGTELSKGNITMALNLAREAIQMDPNNGTAQLVIANAYYSSLGSGACSGFDLQAASWVVYDNAVKARGLLQESGQQELLQIADKIAADARSRWPEAQQILLRGIEIGSSYNVNCGVIRGNTTVRGK